MVGHLFPSSLTLQVSGLEQQVNNCQCELAPSNCLFMVHSLGRQGKNMRPNQRLILKTAFTVFPNYTDLGHSHKNGVFCTGETKKRPKISISKTSENRQFCPRLSGGRIPRPTNKTNRFNRPITLNNLCLHHRIFLIPVPMGMSSELKNSEFLSPL